MKTPAVVTDKHREALEKLRGYLWSPHHGELFLRDLAELFPATEADAAHAAERTRLEGRVAELEQQVAAMTPTAPLFSIEPLLQRIRQSQPPTQGATP